MLPMCNSICVTQNGYNVNPKLHHSLMVICQSECVLDDGIPFEWHRSQSEKCMGLDIFSIKIDDPTCAVTNLAIEPNVVELVSVFI